MKCYISHYSKNKERLLYLEEKIIPVLSRSNLFTEIIIVEGLDREHPEIKKLNKLYSLSAPKISNIKKHFLAWEMFKKSKDELCLVFEDDVMFERRLEISSEKEIIDELKNMLAQVIDEHNFITLGSGLHQHGDSDGLTKKTYGRSTDSYIISKKFLEYHDEESFEYDLPIGHYIDKILNENNDYLWWYEPTIFRQGSQNNIYKSSIFTQSEKIMMNINKLMMNINKLLKKTKSLFNKTSRQNKIENQTIFKSINFSETNDVTCYIIHYTKNAERLSYLENEVFPILIDSNLFKKITLINELDKQDSNIKNLSKKSLLTRAEISVTLKHFKAWEIFSQDNDEHCLVLEDDILFEERLIKAGKTEIIAELKTFFNSIDQEYNYMTLGAGLHQHGDNLGFNKKTNGRSPDSYVISKKFLEYHDEESYEYDLPIGHYIDKILNKNKDYLWWYEPTIFRQGTHNNFYKSNISRFYKLQKFFNV